ncbi:imidazolonepropionase [Alkaliphilus sp. MSJ-5]|uniref:Imidazolonepropionase n=1 Tax=Alkaliphilus flagellatus TaxID=2841507 RepID=A0ABS6G2I1_9FIRM|nr:imidazolonepropionase [Alkaliphilus flagellatus]MBU5675615.1 imidazolonepropionase [Alkaliphilus flagellatus]
MVVDVLIKDISQLITVKSGIKAKKGREMQNIGLIENGWIAIKENTIIGVGSGDIGSEFKIQEHTLIVDGKGKTVTPGLIDPHTHLVHGGSRENELALKLKGVPYLEILKKGGGILSTVRATQNSTLEELVNQSKKSLDRMLTYGVTTVEVKSGYGLEIDTEIKQLEAIDILNKQSNSDLVSTFMGAHAIPGEYRHNPDEFVDVVINEMLPIVAEKQLAEFCDVFCEEGVFSIDQTRKILKAAEKLGLKSKIHADEIISLGGAELAAELGVVSADHLMAASEEGLKMMAEKDVVAVALPGTSFNLAMGKYANVRKMIDYGLSVALATDYNPGSCPTENIQLIMSLGCLYLKMTPEEVISAVTINAAAAINREHEIGSIEIGKKADIVIFDAPNLYYIPYHFGVNHVDIVIKNGKIVVKEGRLI